MKVHRVAIATLISLLSSSSPSSISLCNGLSASKPNNNRRKSSFTAKIVEDVVVQEVSAKVNRKRKPDNNNAKPKPLNARQKSFSQRDPIISLNMVRQVFNVLDAQILSSISKNVSRHNLLTSSALLLLYRILTTWQRVDKKMQPTDVRRCSYVSRHYTKMDTTRRHLMSSVIIVLLIHTHKVKIRSKIICHVVVMQND